MFSVNDIVFKHNYCVVPKENPDEKDTELMSIIWKLLWRLTFKDFTLQNL